MNTQLGEPVQQLQPVVTPLRVEAWKTALQEHSDSEYVNYLVQGFQHGFRIGFDRKLDPVKSASKNMPAASEEPEVVKVYLRMVALGRIIGPLPLPAMGDPGIHTSHFWVIPKPHQPGKWRLIVDLSYPKGASVNDRVDPELCSLCYASIDAAASTVVKKGRGAMLAKLDIANPYHIVPVHPDVRPLLGMKWKGKLYVDTALLFGLRLAPKVFKAVADALEWVLHNRGACDMIHYLDDYLFIGTPGSGDCATTLQLAEKTCAELGVPLAMEKREGPAESLVFLGIVLDSASMGFRLPQDKLQQLCSMVDEWAQRQSCTKRELLSFDRPYATSNTDC